MIKIYQKRKVWGLLNPRMQDFLRFKAELIKDFPTQPVRGSRVDRHLNVSLYVLGVTDKCYRTSLGENLNYDIFFDGKEVKEDSSISSGDLIIIGESKSERMCHRHHHSEVPNLLIAHSGVYVGELESVRLYFGLGWGRGNYGVSDIAKLQQLCHVQEPEHQRELRIYDKKLFEPKHVSEQLTKLLLKEDMTYRG